MSPLADFVMKHAAQADASKEGSINMEFFHVQILNKPDVKTFVQLTNEHQGDFGSSNPLDGTEQNYMKLGGWIGDQGLAMMYMAIGVHLQLFKLLTPSTMMPQLPAELRKQMAGRGMVSVMATPMGKALGPKLDTTQKVKVLPPKPEPFVGQKIKALRRATNDERESFGFEHRMPFTVIELENGEIICPSRDDEGNGPGVLFTLSPDGTTSRLV